MEKTILVSYDLVIPGKDYNQLLGYLRTYGTRAKPLESLWVLKTNKSTEGVRNTIRDYYIDKNDKLFVIDVTGRSAAWSNLGDDNNNWIKNNL